MAIPSELKHHRDKIGWALPYNWSPTYERVPRGCLDNLQRLGPEMGDIKKIKKTVNLIGKDDCAMAIAYHTYRIIRKYHPDRHQVLIVFMEWNSGTAESKKKLMDTFFENYDPVWQIRVNQRSKELVEVQFKFPGMEWLVFG